MKNSTFNNLNKKLLTASILSTALFSQTHAAPLPNGTLLGIERGAGASTNIPCASGSCFGMEVAPGLVIWTEIAPGVDGGIVVGKQQGPGCLPGWSCIWEGPVTADMTDYFFFFADFRWLFTEPNAHLNIFDDASCSGINCIGKTEIKALGWHSGTRGIPLGSANGCLSTNCTADQLAGVFVSNWSRNPTDESYRLDYNNIVPDGDPSGFGSVPFTLILRGTITSNLSQFVSFFIPTEILVNQPAQFTDTSVLAGTIVSWAWTFGDGNTSTEQNPVHTYTQGGYYTLILTVENDQGSVETESQTVLVEPSVRFSVPAEITVGRPTQFTDTSVVAGTIVSWAWSFGYGNTSTEQNPVHTFTQGGIHTIRLTVENDQGIVETERHTVSVEPVSIKLSNLNGKNGFKLNGEASSGGTGRSVSAAGDINGDGLDDLIIGSPSSASHVVFGRTQAFSTQIELSSLDGSNGFRLNSSGSSVSEAGDINGDGLDDLIIGNIYANNDKSGASYVVFGNNQGFAAQFELSSLNGSNGFKLNGETLNDYSGNSVSTAGDINGDGLDDLIIGASSAGNAGASYVVFGSTHNFSGQFELSSLDGTNGFKINGETSGDQLGRSVSSAGDINGDGLDDLIIGASNAAINGINTGASYVVFGSTQGFAAQFDLSSLDGSNGFRINGEISGDQFGRSVSSAGDINGDGLDDLIIGAPQADPHQDRSGASYVVFGSTQGFVAQLELSSLDGKNGFKLNGENYFDQSGWSVSAVGDINGDGLNDLIIGAYSADPYGNRLFGASYVVFGRTQGVAAQLDLSSLDGSNGFRLNGEASGDFSGTSVSAAGDINGDGLDDLIIGAPGAEPNGNSSGASYVVFGKTEFFPTPTPVPTTCEGQYPQTEVTMTGKGKNLAVEETMTTTFKGHIVSTDENKHRVTICPGTTVGYNVTTTIGTARCTIKHGVTAETVGTLADKDKLVCTNRPGGKDTDKFKIKRSKKNDAAVERRWFR